MVSVLASSSRITTTAPEPLSNVVDWYGPTRVHGGEGPALQTYRSVILQRARMVQAEGQQSMSHGEEFRVQVNAWCGG